MIDFSGSLAPAPLRAGLGLATLFCLGLSDVASANEGDSFLCEIEAGGRVEEAFPEAVGVAVGSESEGTFVMDPIINNYYGEPIKAKVLADNEKRLSLRWVVDVKNEATGTTAINLQYELLILKRDLSARMRLKNSVGDTLEFTAPGTCVREK